MISPKTPAEGQSFTSEGRWGSFFGRDSAGKGVATKHPSKDKNAPSKWSMGILNDPLTQEVPGSVLLLTGKLNEPLGLRNAPSRTAHSSIPSGLPPAPLPHRSASHDEKKKTKDGAIILEPQPDDSHNDPLNWPSWRRDAALLSLGFYCMVGGGMTPILAAGFTNVASTYDVTVPQVALTTGLYMMGLGVGSVIASPTAILFGKRPVYLVSCILFIATTIWCALSPSYVSLVVARVIQGIAVSPVECLPSATIAEIFFLHERAYRIGIYGLLLLGGKNLIPLISAAIIQTLEWRWVFWLVAIVVGFCWCLLFLFVPETFWDRTPRPRSRANSLRLTTVSLFGSRRQSETHPKPSTSQNGHADPLDLELQSIASPQSAASQPNLSTRPPLRSGLHVGFASGEHSKYSEATRVPSLEQTNEKQSTSNNCLNISDTEPKSVPRLARHDNEHLVQPVGGVPPTPGLHNFNSPFYSGIERSDSDYIVRGRHPAEHFADSTESSALEPECLGASEAKPYTKNLKEAPQRTFVQQLKPYEGRLHHDKWLKVACRPFILFAYPAVLWSSVVYACSVGWLIVLSESVAVIYRDSSTYNFSALSTGLIYISPFVGGIIGTAVAGKVSDIIVRAMSRRNGGLYEPEFRLVMAVPVALATVIGLMGFGWSAEVHDAWIVPTIFFGVISFGCSLGATTAITFCVDSYRQYAGEALVTLNFTKNVFHGLVFSLFFNNWLEAEGSKRTFIALGIIQLGLLLTTIPMYIYGKRARMWTVRRNFMEKF